MGSFTFASVADVFPVGTSVGAYLPNPIPDAASPVSGAAVATAVVASDGSLAFSGLADDTRYVAWDGARRKSFRTRVSVGITSVDLREYGAKFDGTTDDKAAIDAAIAQAVSDGGARLIGPDRHATLVTTGGHVIQKGVYVELPGIDVCTVKHIGVGNACFKLAEGGSPQGHHSGGVKGFSLIRGVADDASTVGIQVSDSFGMVVEDVAIGGRTSAVQYVNGCAVLMQNETYWTEGTVLRNVRSFFNAVALRFQNLLNADPTKNNSFAYTKMEDFLCQVPANGIGIDFGGPLGDVNPILLYNALLDGHLWGAQGASHVNNVCLLVRKAAQIPPLTTARLRGEVIGGTGNIWIRNIGDGTNGGRFNPSGHVHVYRDGGCTDDLQAGSQTAQHRVHIGLSNAPTAAVPSDLGNRDSGVGAWLQTHSQFGHTQKSNEEATYSAGYDFAGAPIHRFVKKPLTKDPAAPWDVEANTVGWVDNSGALNFGLVSDPRRIKRVGASTPEGNVVGSKGDIAIRTLTTGAALYVKASGEATNTGWVCISALKGTKVFDWASVAGEVLGAGDTAQTTVAVVGAALGDFALASMDVALPQGVFLAAQVTAADIVTVTLINGSTSAYDAASCNLAARVQKN